MTTEVRHCWRCTDLKPRSEFPEDKAQPDGIGRYCNACLKSGLVDQNEQRNLSPHYRDARRRGKEANSMVPDQVREQVNRMTATVLGPTGVRGMVRLSDSYMDAFGGPDEVARRALAVFDDPDTKPHTKTRILELIARLVDRATQFEKPPDYSTFSEKDLEITLEQIIARRIERQSDEMLDSQTRVESMKNGNGQTDASDSNDNSQPDTT